MRYLLLVYAPDGPAAAPARSGGVDLLVAPTIDEAIGAAERILTAREGVVEIRPLAEEAAA